MEIFKKVTKRVARESLRLTMSSFAPKDLLKHEATLKEIRSYISSEEANNLIGDMLNSGKPFLVSRFGSIELQTTILFRKMQTLTKKEKLADFGITGDWSFGWPSETIKTLENNAGFFLVNTHCVERFAKTMIDSMPSVDLLGSWGARGEGYFANELVSATICNLPNIEPYYHQNPWSQHLKGRNVLVIHPFSSSIQSQYGSRREHLFRDSLVLPEFNLKTVPAVQSIAGNRPVDHKDWFSALNYMFSSALSVDAEVVILGCGAYGLPLGAMLKSAGKQVIHLGGATQILFGIKGSRWDKHPVISTFYNDYWVRPSAGERPAGAEKVEAACYW